MDLFDYDLNCGNANIAKEVILQTLYNNEEISEEQYQEYHENWGVIIVKRKWFQNIFKKDLNKYKVIFVRVVG